MAEYSPSKIIKDGNTYNFRDTTKIPLAGSNAISGSLIPSTDGTVNLGGPSYQWNNAYIKSLTINGTACGDILTHNVSEFVPRSGGAVMTGNSIFKTHNNTGLMLGGGTSESDGGSINLVGNNGYFTGDVVVRATKPNENYCVYFFRNTAFFAQTSSTLGNSTYKWGQIYSTNSTISTSDSRLKNNVKDIDDKLLDAWENVEPKQYKFNDATEKKGEKARFHTGYIAQDIQAECEKQGVNASDYGLFCYDEWDEQEEVSEEIETEKDGKKVKEKRVIQPKREKGNSYALRYEEALVVECKYLRRCIARLTARIEELEKENNTK